MKINNAKELLTIYQQIQTIPDYKGDSIQEPVEKLIQIISKSSWIDFQYDVSASTTLLRNKELLINATENQIRSVLTAFTRGERFSDGFTIETIKQGYLHNVMHRLAELKNIKFDSTDEV